MNEKILNQLNALGIEQRKLVRGQQSLSSGVDELRGLQEELLRMMRALDAKSILRDQLPEAKEEWLNISQVMKLLFITKSTFYRRRILENWVRKKNGRSWLYLKSSVLGKNW